MKVQDWPRWPALVAVEAMVEAVVEGLCVNWPLVAVEAEPRWPALVAVEAVESMLTELWRIAAKAWAGSAVCIDGPGS